jgi:hypothetical protein
MQERSLFMVSWIPYKIQRRRVSTSFSFISRADVLVMDVLALCAEAA